MYFPDDRSTLFCELLNFRPLGRSNVVLKVSLFACQLTVSVSVLRHCVVEHRGLVPSRVVALPAVRSYRHAGVPTLPVDPPVVGVFVWHEDHGDERGHFVVGRPYERRPEVF